MAPPESAHLVVCAIYQPIVATLIEKIFLSMKNFFLRSHSCQLRSSRAPFFACEIVPGVDSREEVMMKPRRIWTRISLTTGFLAALAASSAQAAETLRVGKANATSFVFALVDAGIGAGIFEKHGLILEIADFGGGPRLQQALAANSVDIGLSSGPDMALVAKGAPVKAVAAIFNGVDQVIAVNPTSGIDSVDQLKGKTFSASSPASLTGWLPRHLAVESGWGEDGVKLQIIASLPSGVAMLETNQIEAITVDPATAFHGEKTGKMKIIYRYSELLPKFHQYAIYATDSVISEKHDQLRAFLTAWFETVSYARTHKEEFVVSAAQAIGIEKETLSQVYDVVMPLYSDDGRFDAEAMDILLESFVTNGVLSTRPEISDVTNAQFLPAAR